MNGCKNILRFAWNWTYKQVKKEKLTTKLLSLLQ